MNKFIMIALSFLLYLNPSFATESEDELNCEEGTTYNANTNRCVHTQSTLKLRENFTKCDSIESEQEKSECMQEAALNKAESVEDSLYKDISAKDLDKNKKNSSVITGVTSAFSAISVYQMFFAKESKGLSNASLSSKIFAGTSIAGFAKNLFFEKDVKEKTGKMLDQFKEEVADMDGMKDAQVRAFDYLKEEQEYLKSHAKKQKSFYNIMALGYFGAMGTAMYEMFTAKDGASCMKEAASILDKVSCPPVLIPVAATAGALSYKLANAAGDQADQAKENIEKIETIKTGFLKSIEGLCPDGREDMSNPTCFCYDADGTKNSNRTNSQTCQNHWNRYKNLWVEVAPASKVFDITKTEGCQYLDGKYDPTCACRNVLDAKGNNACMRFSTTSQSATALAGIDATPAYSSLNELLQGNQSSAVFDTDVGAGAAAADAKRNQILKKLSSTLKKKGVSNPQKVSDYITNQMSKKLKGQKAPYPLLSSANSNTKAFLPPAAQKLIDDAKKNGISDLKISTTKARSLNLKPKKKTKKENKWFDMGEDAMGQNQGVVTFQDLPTDGKKYKYKDSDIVKDKSASIWKVLSNRYNNSGLRRLFDE